MRNSLKILGASLGAAGAAVLFNTGTANADSPVVMPVAGCDITTHWNGDPRSLDCGGGPNGVGTQIVSALSGTVRSVSDGCPTWGGFGNNCGGGYGNNIVIDHDNGVTLRYSHLEAGGIAVSPGQRVDVAQPIGTMGSSGSSTGPHLDFHVETGQNAAAVLSGAMQPGELAAPAPAPAPPAPPPPPPAPEPVTVPGPDWDLLAMCESGDLNVPGSARWNINSGNGFYGGLQFSPSTWMQYGGGQFAPSAEMATREQQIAIAEKVLADPSQGPDAWPMCSQQKIPGWWNAGTTTVPAPAPETTPAPAPVESAVDSILTNAPAPVQDALEQFVPETAPAPEPKPAPVQESAPAAPVESILDQAPAPVKDAIAPMVESAPAPVPAPAPMPAPAPAPAPVQEYVAPVIEQLPAPVQQQAAPFVEQFVPQVAPAPVPAPAPEPFVPPAPPPPPVPAPAVDLAPIVSQIQQVLPPEAAPVVNDLANQINGALGGFGFP